MLDKTLVSIVAMVFGGVGLIGAITRYDIPRAKRSVYGENLFALKENIINSVVTWIFTIYAMVGLIFQIIFGEIFELEDRLHNTSFYFWALLAAIIVTMSLIPLMKRMSRWLARDYWLPELIKKAKENFLLAKSFIEKDNADENHPQALKITDWLEELFEMKSDKADLQSRLKFFEEYFEKNNL